MSIRNGGKGACRDGDDKYSLPQTKKVKDSKKKNGNSMIKKN